MGENSESWVQIHSILCLSSSIIRGVGKRDQGKEDVDGVCQVLCSLVHRIEKLQCFPMLGKRMAREDEEVVSQN